MRCPKCGNENPETNRFCGMCGTTLLQTAAAVSVAAPASPPRHGASPPAPDFSPQPPRSAPAEEVPVISGPSFLGLNEPPPRKRASLSIDPHASPSRELDYLLDDQEEEKGGAGKYFAILIALALVVGLGYLRWKGHGFAGLGLETKKPAAAAQNTEASDSASSQPTASAPIASSQPAAPSTGLPGVGQIGTNPAGSPPEGASQPAAIPSAAAQAPPAHPATASPVPAATSAAAPATSPSSDGTGASSSAASPAGSDRAAAPAANAAPGPAAASVDTPPASKPASASASAPSPSSSPSLAPSKPAKPVTMVDPVAEAQKYIYGKGVPQSCDRGLRLLKPAADQSNARAMIEMGALYSAGLCTPRDLPTAYRWFALALRKDPANQSVQNDLQKLWGEMTQPERQLAIRLSQ